MKWESYYFISNCGWKQEQTRLHQFFQWIRIVNINKELKVQ